MKIICSQNDLNTHLTLVSRAVPKRPTHQVLANVLFEADVNSQQIVLTAYDLSLELRTSFAAQVDENTSLLLPAKLFSDIVAKLPQEDLTIEISQSEGEKTDDSDTNTEDSENTSASENYQVEGKTAIAVLISSSGRYQIQGMTAEEFPDIPFVEGGSSVVLSIECILEGLRGALFAASTDEAKQLLMGVRLVVTEEGVEFAATDGHRLAVVETSNELEEEGISQTLESDLCEVTIPTRAWQELERMLASRDRKESIQLCFDVEQAVFKLGNNQRLTTRTLEGKYPAYRQIIPESFQKQVTVDRKQLLQGLELISVLANRKNNVVKFNLNAETNKLSLSAEAQDGSGNETLDAEISGDSIDIAFNAKYVMDSLKHMKSSQVQLHLNASDSAVILQPLGGTKITHLIMPIHLKS